MKTENDEFDEPRVVAVLREPDRPSVYLQGRVYILDHMKCNLSCTVTFPFLHAAVKTTWSICRAGSTSCFYYLDVSLLLFCEFVLTSLSGQEVTVDHFLSALPCLMSWTLTTSWIECLPQAASSNRALTISWTLHLYQTVFFCCLYISALFLFVHCKKIYTSVWREDFNTWGEKVSRCRCSFTCSDWKHLTGCKTSTSGRAALKTHWSFSLSLRSRLSGISLRAGQRLACCFVFVCNV